MRLLLATQFRHLPYGSLTKGGRGVTATGYLLYRRREEAYHYTHVGGGCVGTTYMGSPRVDTCTLCISCIFYQKKSCFRGSPEK